MTVSSWLLSHKTRSKLPEALFDVNNEFIMQSVPWANSEKKNGTTDRFVHIQKTTIPQPLVFYFSSFSTCYPGFFFHFGGGGVRIEVQKELISYTKRISSAIG